MMRSIGSFLLLVLLCEVPVHAQSHAPTSLREAALSPQVRRDIVAVIAQQFLGRPMEFPSGDTIALNSTMSLLQLSPSGPAAILVTAGPDDPDNGATGNGDLWLFRRVGTHAVLVFRGGGSGFAVVNGKTFHNGMLDVRTSWNMSCCQGGVEVYRFNGKLYKPLYCYDYTTDDDGNMKFGPKGKCDD